MISLDEISKILSCSSFKYKLNLTEIEKSNCCDVGDHFNGNIYRILVKGSVTINNEERGKKCKFRNKNDTFLFRPLT